MSSGATGIAAPSSIHGSPRIVAGGNGMFRPAVVSDGQIVGTWAWTGRGNGRTVTATPFAGFSAEVAAAIARAAPP